MPEPEGISVVVATYQRPGDTAELVESVRNSYRSFQDSVDAEFELEMLVVCDERDSSTIQRLEDLEWERLEVVESSNHMLSHNRHLGIENSSFDYVAGLDSDCVVLEDWVRNVYDALTELDKPGFIQGAYYLDYPEDTSWFTRAEAAEDRSRFKDRQADSRNIMMSKELYHDIGGYETRYAWAGVSEDLRLRERVERAGGAFVFDRSIKAYHKYSGSLVDNLRRYRGFGKGAVHLERTEPELFREKYGPRPQVKSAVENFFTALVGENEKRGVPRALYLWLKTLFYVYGYLVGRYIYWLEVNFGKSSLRSLLSAKIRET